MKNRTCSTCKLFSKGIRTEAGECMDKTKVIYPRGGDRFQEEPPWIEFPDQVTCLNHEP